MQLAILLPSPTSPPILLLTRQAVAHQLLILLNRCQHFVAGTVNGSFGIEESVMGLVVTTGGRINMLKSE